MLPTGTKVRQSLPNRVASRCSSACGVDTDCTRASAAASGVGNRSCASNPAGKASASNASRTASRPFMVATSYHPPINLAVRRFFFRRTTGGRTVFIALPARPRTPMLGCHAFVEAPAQKEQDMKAILTAVCLASFLAACASAPTVNTDHDPSVNFANYRTYFWLKQPEGVNPLAQQRIVAGVDGRLAAKGWRAVPQAEAD